MQGDGMQRSPSKRNGTLENCVATPTGFEPVLPP
jgi:hypothetical protein